MNYGSSVSPVAQARIFGILFIFSSLFTPHPLLLAFPLKMHHRYGHFLPTCCYHPNQSHHYFLPELAQQSPNWARYCRHISLRMKTEGCTQWSHAVTSPLSLLSSLLISPALPFLHHILRAPLCRLCTGCSLYPQGLSSLPPPYLCVAHPLPP